MIEKTHTKGVRVIIHDPAGSGLFKDYHGKTGTLMSDYGCHTVAGVGVQFWGYYVRLDTSEIIGVSRRLLNLLEAEPQMPRRGDLDRKIAWKDCAWQPQRI